MTPDDAKAEAERRILSSLAASIAATANRVAAVRGLPVEATATSLIGAACFLIEDAHGKDVMLTWLQGELEGRRANPNELKNKPN